MKRRFFLCCLLAAGTGAAAAQVSEAARVIWNPQAAHSWKMGYPTGNGRLGALSLGAWPKETIILNEDSIWARKEAHYPKNAADVYQKIYRLALEGKYAEADEVFEKQLDPRFTPGPYEFAGHLLIEHVGAGKPSAVTNSLDLFSGLNRSTAVFEDGTMTREIVALRNRDLLAIHLSSTRRSGLHVRLSLVRPKDDQAKVSTKGGLLTLSAQAVGGGTRFRTAVLPLPGKGGKVLFHRDGTVELKGGKEALLLCTTVTDFNFADPDHPKTQWEKEAKALLDRSRKVSWTDLRDEAAAEMRGFMERCIVDLGATDPETAHKPTGERIAAYRDGGRDPDLEELLFQFGRYCLVASSRPGGLPANLQGLWSEGLTPPWEADYHLNINIQMNYWLAEPTGLSELHQPLLDLAAALPRYGKPMAEALGYTNGFCTGHAINAWPATWFSGGNACWAANLISGAWVVSHLMEHYRFSGDRRFLAEKAWPAMRENVAFLLDWITKDEKTGEWITGPDSSPENTFIYTDADGKKREASISCGTSHDLMLTWESLTDLIEAARILGREDDPVVRRAKEVLPRLAQAKIGPDGRLQEWREPFEEKEPGHRHLSHGYGFFPGHQYNFLEHPKMVEALKKSLDYRLSHGGGHTGWSRAWLINLQAVLLRPEKAYENLRALISKNINPNLFDMIYEAGERWPFQIDANFGYTAGVATMLLQSRIRLESGERVIQLLPAQPREWAKGEADGLRTRGGLTVKLRWTPERVDAVFQASRPGTFLVLCRGERRTLKLAAGECAVLRFPGKEKKPAAE